VKFLDEYALKEADVAALRSDDPKTQVGAVVLDERGIVLVKGANTLPWPTTNTQHNRLADPTTYASRTQSPLKDKYMEHAERNLIYAAARHGISLSGRTLAVNWFPCAPCARAIVQSGITKLVGREPDFDHPKYGEDFKAAMQILREAGVTICLEEKAA